MITVLVGPAACTHLHSLFYRNLERIFTIAAAHVLCVDPGTNFHRVKIPIELLPESADISCKLTQTRFFSSFFLVAVAAIVVSGLHLSFIWCI